MGAAYFFVFFARRPAQQTAQTRRRARSQHICIVALDYCFCVVIGYNRPGRPGAKEWRGCSGWSAWRT